MSITAIQNALHHLTDFAEKDPHWQEHHHQSLKHLVDCAAHYLDIDEQTLAKELYHHEASMPFSYAVWEYSATIMQNETQGSLLDTYLQQRGWREDEEAQNYLKGLTSTPLHLWEVISVSPGEYMEIKQYGTDEPSIKMYDKEATYYLAKWDCFIARILTENLHKPIMGLAFLTLSPMEPLSIDTYREAITSIDSSVTDDACYIVVWLILCYHRIHAFDETDEIDETHDPYIHTTTTWPITGDREAIITKIDDKDTFQRIVPDEDEWVWNKKSYITLYENRITLETYTQTDAEEGKTILSELLGELVKTPLTTHENTKRMLEDTEEEAYLYHTQEEETFISEEAQSTIHEIMHEHLLSLLDTPLDVLDNKTPRECAQSSIHQDALLAWLKHIENQYLQQPDFPAYDFTELWKTLGLK